MVAIVDLVADAELEAQAIPLAVREGVLRVANQRGTLLQVRGNDS